MNKLRLSLLEVSFAEEPSLVCIYIKIQESVVSIFQGLVDFSEFIFWLKDNEQEIRSTALPIYKKSGESLAKRIRYFYEKLENEDDEIVDLMFDYRFHHCFRFAARGTSMPEIYIGKSEDGHEVSISNIEKEWRYFIDIEDFYSNLKKL